MPLKKVRSEDLQPGALVYGHEGVYGANTWGSADSSKKQGWVYQGGDFRSLEAFKHTKDGRPSAAGVRQQGTIMIIEDTDPEINEWGEVCL